MNNPLTKEFVYQEYTLNGRSDNEIAKSVGIDRTAVVHFRKFHCIPTRQYTGRIGELVVIERLRRMGFTVADMNEKSKIHSFDLLVNEVARIEVKSSTIGSDNRWHFQLAHKPLVGISPKNPYYHKLPGGKWRKDFAKTCDVIVFCGLSGGGNNLFVIKSTALPRNISTFSVGEYFSKYWIDAYENWGAIYSALEMFA